MVAPIWHSIQNACEIARFVGIERPYNVRLTTANAEALIAELRSIGKPAEIVWRVGEQLLSLRAGGVEIVVDDEAPAMLDVDPGQVIAALHKAIQADTDRANAWANALRCPKCQDGTMRGKINGGLKCDRCPHEIICY